jgi:preprotein translocase subunit SecG
MTTFIETFANVLAIFFTVGCLTLPFKDNVYWKICESMYIGFAAGYTFIINLNALNSNLFKPLTSGNFVYVIPLILSILFYTRYIRSVRWLGRYPVALIIGVGTAVSMRTIVSAQFVNQIKNTIISPFAPSSGIVGIPKTPINNIFVIISVLSVVYYFVFMQTEEKAGMVSSTSSYIRTLGRTLIMTSFGVLMGNEILMRISRLGARFFFILEPGNLIYTGVFALIGIASLVLSKEN